MATSCGSGLPGRKARGSSNASCPRRRRGGGARAPRGGGGEGGGGGRPPPAASEPAGHAPAEDTSATVHFRGAPLIADEPELEAAPDEVGEDATVVMSASALVGGLELGDHPA